MSLRLLTSIMLAGALPGGGVVLAHHSLAAQYDMSRTVELEGIVREVQLVNPHSWILLDVEGEDGEIVTWAVEGGSPNSLIRAGFRSDFIKPGTKIRVQGFPARNDEHLINGGRVTLENGESIFVRNPNTLP